MMPLDIALCLCLLTSPPKTPVPAHAAHLMPQLEHLAIELELLDPRECPAFFRKADELRVDLNFMRERWKELCDCPPAHDAQMFPTRKIANKYLNFNRAYRIHLDERIKMEAANGWELREAVVETDQLWDLWDTVRECHADYYYVSVRRKALRKLRDDLLGYSAYYSGALPPPVPVWRFERID